MRYFYELVDSNEKIVESGPLEAASIKEAEDWADERLNVVCAKEEFPTFAVYEWPEGDE